LIALLQDSKMAVVRMAATMARFSRTLWGILGLLMTILLFNTNNTNGRSREAGVAGRFAAGLWWGAPRAGFSSL
jgi:hypothetical protein